MEISRHVAWVTVAAVFAVWSVGGGAVAAAEPGEDDRQPRPHLRSSLGARVVPVGLTLGNDLGARWSLFESDEMLLQDTWIEPGVTTEISPSNAWYGLYLEAVPLAVLKLHASFQSLHYFGTYGYLHVPSDPDRPDWSLDAIDDRPDSGRAARGWMATLRARPRIKLGSFVAFVKGELRWIGMELDSVYYESTFDMLLEPVDGYGSVVPSAGWVFEFPGGEHWLLAMAGWEHTGSFRTKLSRDLARLLLLWHMPFEIWGSGPELAVLGGHWISHPNRDGTWYLAGQFSLDWML